MYMDKLHLKLNNYTISGIFIILLPTWTMLFREF